MAGAVLGGEVAGDEGAEPAGGAGDEDGLVGVEGAPALPVFRPGRSAEAGQPRRQRHTLAQGELGLLGEGEGGADRPLGGLGAVAVDQGEATGVLGLGRAGKPPQRCDGEVR